MSPTITFELEQARERLAYYTHQFGKTKSPMIKKWVEIYDERVQKLERQLHQFNQKMLKIQSNTAGKQGLTTQLAGARESKSARA